MDNELLIYDFIGAGLFDEGVTATGIKDQLDAMGDVDEITVRVNSPGGDVFDGVAIYNLLKEHPATINVKVDGFAASAASFIAMAGDTVTMGKGSLFMIHNPWTFTFGDAAEMRKQADVLDTVKDQIIEIYQTRSTLSAEELSELMNTDAEWFGEDVAIERGFADGDNDSDVVLNDISAFPWIKDAPKPTDKRTPAPTNEVDGLARCVELQTLRHDIANQRKSFK